ncbi:MAG: DUF1648 domain-containing protein [Thermomicrobiales bacterium]
MYARLRGRARAGGRTLMPPTGPDDRDEGTRRGARPQEPESAAPAAPDVAAREGEIPPPPDVARSGVPPGVREAPPSEMFRHADEAIPPPRDDPSVRTETPDRGYPGQPPPQSAQRYDRFGWPIPEGTETGQDPSRPASPTQENDRRGYPPRGAYSGQFPAQELAPNQLPRGPYSGQFPTQPPPRQSGAFPVPPDVTRSGQFPAPPADPVYQSGAYAVPPAPGTSGYAVTASGPIAQSPYRSGAMPRVGEQPGAMRQSGPLTYPSDVTSTGSRRVIIAPDAGRGSVVSDRPALAFLLAAVGLAGAMIAYIALRYSHFPIRIALHFGPAGSSQPDHIGEKRELWTIPFIVGIVLAANTALAWAVYHYDRFAARLLTLGCTLVAAIAWVVLLTLLHR